VVRPRYLNLPGEPRWAFPDRLIAQAAFRERGSWPQAQVIHGHSAVTGLAAWRLARRTRLPFVITFHGSDLNSWPDRHPEWVPDLRTAARQARAIITVSAALAARFKSITGVAAVHLPLGSDHRSLEALALPRAEARAALHLASDRIVVLFVGVLSADKGVPELVDAIAGRGDQFLGVFVGDGPKKGYGSDDPHSASCLEYRGFRPHDEVALYMSAADVLVLPSHNEGLPTVLVEAGSLGLPVIASAVGGIPALLAEERGTILREVSAEAIGEALVDFGRRRSAATAAAARLREFVLAEHDVDANARRLLEVYGL
jgi:teichuronic acid biosynthesis glycosyltransferase TuaC